MERILKINGDYIRLKSNEIGGLYKLASELGIVYNTLVKYLDSGECRISVVNKIAKLLNVNVEELLIVKIERD